MSAGNDFIRIFTPSDAGEANTNAQNLTVKEVVARLAAEFHVTMFYSSEPDRRIADRPNTTLLQLKKRVNTPRFLANCLFTHPDIYFFPRVGPLDKLFFWAKRHFPLRTALITYIVMVLNEDTSAGLIGQSIIDADLVCGNSKFVSGTIRSRFGVEPRTVCDGVDRRFYFPPSPDSPRTLPLVVLYAGSLQARKRVELVIAQAARLPDVQFRLAGRGPTEENCRQLVERLGCRNVSFLGHLNATELGEEMRRASVFLFPSILEGHPQVLIQAAACGLPAIAMNVYQPDYVVDGQTGFLVDSDSELKDRLDQLLQDSDKRTSMGKAAAILSQQYDWDVITRQWADIFREVVEHRRRRS